MREDRGGFPHGERRLERARRASLSADYPGGDLTAVPTVLKAAALKPFAPERLPPVPRSWSYR